MGAGFLSPPSPSECFVTVRWPASPQLLLVRILTLAHSTHLLHLTPGASGQAPVRVCYQTSSLIWSPSSCRYIHRQHTNGYAELLNVSLRENKKQGSPPPPTFLLIVLPFCSVWGTTHCKHSLMTVMHQSRFIHTVGLRNLN